jgi:hypothetical protein
MLSRLRSLPSGSGYVVLMLLGLLVLGGRKLLAQPGTVMADAEARTLYGAACGDVGGANCGDNTHTCATTGCVTHTACQAAGTVCKRVGGGTYTTYPCNKDKTGGNCCAGCNRNCVEEWWGTPAPGTGCSTALCNQSSYCGEKYCYQYACKGAAPPPGGTP